MKGVILAIFSVLLVVLSGFLVATPANAATTPSFPSCIAPTGVLKVNYESGVHGIPGDPNTYTGKDTVYTISENALAQCFCPTNGSGIQTNWVKAGVYSENDIKVLTAQGWIYIPTGKVWGLEDVPYLAKNESYSCRGSETKVGGASATNPNSSNNSTPGVLGLASTGNFTILLGSAALGMIFLLAGIFLRRNQ